jgi:hypothetical protein
MTFLREESSLRKLYGRPDGKKKRSSNKSWRTL